MKWSTEAKVGAFALAGILLFAGILIELSSLVIFGKSGFHVTGYFKEAEGIEPGNPIHYAGVEVGMVDGLPLCSTMAGVEAMKVMQPLIDAGQKLKPCTTITSTGVMWQAIIHALFIVSAIGIAWTDRIMMGSSTKRDH